MPRQGDGRGACPALVLSCNDLLRSRRTTSIQRAPLYPHPQSSVAGGLSGAFASLFGMPRTLDQVKQQQQQEGGGCPVDHGKGGAAAGAAQASLNPLNNERLYSQVCLCLMVSRSGQQRTGGPGRCHMAWPHALPQAPLPRQRVKLGTERQVSSILKVSLPVCVDADMCVCFDESECVSSMSMYVRKR